jgi:hypothetical protein
MVTSTSARQIALARSRPAPSDLASGLLSSRTKLRTGHSKDAVRAGPLDAFSENGEARGEGSEHAPCRHTLGPRGCHQRSCHGFFSVPCSWFVRYSANAAAAISGICSCSAMASTSSSVRPQKATQSSRVSMPSTGRRVVAPEPKTKKKSGLLECYHQFARLRACRREPNCLLRCSELRVRTMRRTTWGPVRSDPSDYRCGR